MQGAFMVQIAHFHSKLSATKRLVLLAGSTYLEDCTKRFLKQGSQTKIK